MIGKKNRGAVLLMCDDRAGRTGRHTIIALCASFKEQLLFDRTRGTQPIHTSRRRRSFRWQAIGVFDEFMSGSDGRNNGIFQEIPPAV